MKPTPCIVGQEARGSIRLASLGIISFLLLFHFYFLSIILIYSFKLQKLNHHRTQPQVIRKQVLCSAHGKELDLVCTDDSHAPRMVCISCVVTIHRSHSCVTTAEYFAEKQEEMHALLARAQVYGARVEKGVEVVEKERGSIASNRDTVAGQINFFFNRV